jgi:hypothetical protein
MAPKDSAECGGLPTIAAFATLAYWNDIASVSAGATELPRSVGVKNAAHPLDTPVSVLCVDGSNGLLFYSTLKVRSYSG